MLQQRDRIRLLPIDRICGDELLRGRDPACLLRRAACARQGEQALVAALDEVKRAREILYSGDPIDATRAHGFGLVNRLVEPGQALDAAIELAEQICANAPVAVRETRKIVLEATYAPDDVGWDMSNAGMAKAMSSEDLQEGLMAFIEKRPPQWTGR